MTAKEAVNWIINIMADIGKAEHRDLWHYEQALSEIKEMLESQPERKIELHGDESAIEILSELRSWFSCFDEKEGLAYHALSLAIREIKANHTARSEQLEKCPIYGGVCLHPSDQCYECPRHAGAEQIIRCTNCRFFKRNIPCTGGHYNGCEMWLDDGNEIRVMTDDYCSKALPKEGEQECMP